MNSLYKYITLVLSVLVSVSVYAGNPDRQGESGAAELLLNPWARSAGLHGMNTASITGIESMRLNIAGLSRIEGRELVVANTRLYEGADISMNALGFTTKAGTNGAVGVSLVSMDFGDIPVTTESNPAGTGGFINPSFFNIGIGYSYLYDNRISVGFLVRAISESLSDVSAFGLAIDAGVQYVTGPQDNFRLGISLRNVGSPMQFDGQGLAFQTSRSGNQLTVSSRSQDFELPSVLNIGLSYDFHLAEKYVLRALGNFTSNAFSRDQIGGGVEFVFNDMLILRGAYRIEIGDTGSIQENIYTGFAGGLSVDLPFNDAGNKRIGLDYAYRVTDPFRGTHNFSIRLAF